LSNFALGAFSFYLIRRTDRDYSLLIDENVPALYQSRHVGQQAGIAYRSVIAALLTQDPATCSAQLARVQAALARGDELRAAVLKLDLLRSRPDLTAEYQQAAEDFNLAAKELLPRITPADTVDAERDRIQHLQDLYERVIAVNEKIATVAASDAQAGSDGYSAQSQVRSELMLGLASWPLLVAALIVGLTLIIVVVMLVVFRQAVISDEP
jgi:hypothetical protein